MKNVFLMVGLLLTGCAQYEAAIQRYDSVDNKVSNVKSIVYGAKDIKSRTKQVAGQ